jgi:hypothetical protein
MHAAKAEDDQVAHGESRGGGACGRSGKGRTLSFEGFEGTMGATLAKLIDGLERLSTWRNAALGFGGIVLSNLAMGGYIIPNIEARRPEAVDDGFLVMIDLEPLRSAEEVYRIFDLYEPDVLGFVRLLYAVDFVMPVAFSVCLVCLIGMMLRYLEVKEGGWRAVLLLPLVAVLFDYAENAASLFLIGQYQDGRVFPTLARVASVMTAVKFLCLACAGLAMVVLLIRTVMKLVARRAGSPRGA